MLILILPVFLSLFSFQAHAQNEPMFNTEEGKYGEERSRGDLAATKSRTDFEIAVCRKSLEIFCPSKNTDEIKTVKDCSDQQVACHAMTTSVATRFISKYGKGSESANQDALPLIGQILDAFEDFRFTGLHRKEMIQEVASFSGGDLKKVQRSLIQFISHYDSKRPPKLYVDFWGYFQQWYPQRPQFTYREDGTLETIAVAFRFCGTPLMFVKEQNIARDVFAQAIFSEDQLTQLTSGEQYTQSCEDLEKKWRQAKK